ncbi:MAG: pyridine nucleotide-disulfide oxidoreductase, partial [Clostridiales bacterium]|nr:pyridine nucleotide-disulfide oxidoreductase [Clostridiales bacterium]
AIEGGTAVAGNILAEVRGLPRKEFKPNLHGVVVSIGGRFAASQIIGIQFPRPLSVLAKKGINTLYLFEIGGVGMIFKMVKRRGRL